MNLISALDEVPPPFHTTAAQAFQGKAFKV
jgi:hypothetical protein